MLTKRTHRVIETAKKWSEHGADYTLCWVHDSAEFESSLIKCSVSFFTSSVVFLSESGQDLVCGSAEAVEVFEY